MSWATPRFITGPIAWGTTAAGSGCDTLAASGTTSLSTAPWSFSVDADTSSGLNPAQNITATVHVEIDIASDPNPDVIGEWRLNGAPLTPRAFTDTLVPDGTHTYDQTVVLPYGDSIGFTVRTEGGGPLSLTITIELSDITCTDDPVTDFCLDLAPPADDIYGTGNFLEDGSFDVQGTTPSDVTGIDHYDMIYSIEGGPWSTIVHAPGSGNGGASTPDFFFPGSDISFDVADVPGTYSVVARVRSANSDDSCFSTWTAPSAPFDVVVS